MEMTDIEVAAAVMEMLRRQVLEGDRPLETANLISRYADSIKRSEFDLRDDPPPPEPTTNDFQSVDQEISQWFISMPNVDDPSPDMELESSDGYAFLQDAINACDLDEDFCRSVARIVLAISMLRPRVDITTSKNHLRIELTHQPY